MNKLFNFIGGVAFLTLAGQVNAAPINVGGVVWDPDAVSDFSNFSLAIHQDIDAVTGVVSGFGSISTLNSTNQATFCPGCELTFTFDGFTPIGTTVLPSALSVINYSGGTVNFYVDNTPELSDPVVDPLELTLANTSDGDLWLALTGHALPGGSELEGTVNGAGNLLTGAGLLDVVGGLAAANIDTNTQADGAGGFADLSFTNSFTQFPTGTILNANGTGNLFGDSVPTEVPEPTSLVLLGLGLLGFSASRFRKV